MAKLDQLPTATLGTHDVTYAYVRPSNSGGLGTHQHVCASLQVKN